MSDIFLSYKSEDKPKAQIIAGALEKKGYSVWWDLVIPVGRTFDEIIEKELDAAKCVVVLWSEKSVKAKWVITEAGEGDSRGILAPVLIEEVKPPLAFRRIEAAKLMDWDGTSDHAEFDLLLNSISGILGQSHKTVDMEKVEKTFTNSIGMDFVWIPAGEFDMGSNANESDMYDGEKPVGGRVYYPEAKPVHRVKISLAFYMGKYEVTQKQWNVVMRKNPSYFKGDNLPVEEVSWKDVQEFITKLNQREATYKYRLPTEAEWEYAARAGTTTSFSFGDDESKIGDYAWFDANSGGTTHEVGQKKPNPWGLYDMHGNVWEWIEDIYYDSYDGAPTDGSAWEREGWEGEYHHVIRGGCIESSLEGMHEAHRFYSIISPKTGFLKPGDHSNLGFRLVRDL